MEIGHISKITLPDSSTYSIKDSTARARIDEKIFIDGLSTESLSMLHISESDFYGKVIAGTALSNELYVVSSNYINAYGQQVKNLKAGTDLSDAVTLEQLSNAVSSIQIPSDLSSFTNSPGYLVSDDISGYYKKTETSSASELSNALSAKADLSSIEHVVQYDQDEYGNYTGVTIGIRLDGYDIGERSFVQGTDCVADNINSHAEGYYTIASNDDAHAEGAYTSAFGAASHAEGYGTITDNQGTHTEGGYTSAFGYYSHTEGGWTSTGEYAIGAHAEGGFTRADGPISHVEGVKATAELSDYQSFVWQGTDVMPNELTDITPSTWDEYKAHGPGTFNINPAKGLNGVYIGDTSLYDLIVDDHMTIIKFDNGEAHAFDWSGDITQVTMIDAGLYDDNEGSWTLNPACVKIGNSVTSIGDNAFVGCSGLTSMTIPDSVTSIGEEAFSGCENLRGVTIPNSVTSIGSTVFYGCSSLMGIVIGKNVAVVGNNAFENCTSLSNDSNLSSITIDKGNWEKLLNDVDFEYYRSNKISDDESTSMSASIEASESFPVTIKLKTSSEENCDILTLMFDGQELTSMSGETGWQYMPVTIPSGSHTVVLTYSKDGSVSDGDDHAYFAIVQGCIAVKSKTQEEAEQLLADTSVPETCKIITIDDSSASGENQTNVTYAELAQMRNNGSLAPGMKYRITDYVTKIDQEDCRSAEHPFDLIVTAIDYHTLDEHAVATLPSNGDDYFAAREFHVQAYTQYLEYRRVPLESWDIKYCLDNDKTRFRFADAENGKGVIYWMKDEFGNEAPYDFKNVQFKRYRITEVNSSNSHSLVGTYGLQTDTVTVDDSDYIWCYTFNGDDYADYGFSAPYDFSGWHISPTQALQSQFNGAIERLQECSENLIGAWQESGADYTLMAFKLPNIVFHCALNVVPVEQLPFLKIGMCSQNRFGKNCYDSTFGQYCYNNTFGDYCASNTFGDYCKNNMFGKSCKNNTFGSDCDNNTFGSNCDNNTFGSDCDNNTFGSDCDNNTFGSDCASNTFGSDCDNNSFVSDCDNNTFGSDCASNTFGSNCAGNTFGNICQKNRFGAECVYIKFALTATSDPTQAKSYYRYINIDSGNSYIILNCTQSTYDGHEYKNVRILPGVNNTTTYKTITDNNVNQSFCTTYQPANSQVIAV